MSDKIFYHTQTGNAAVFASDANVADWPDYQETKPPSRLKKEALDRRLSLLHSSDPWALTDRTMTQAQIDYRQALRDLTTQQAWTDARYDDLVWPSSPL